MPDEAMLKRNRDADRLERQASAVTLDANCINYLALDRPEKRLSVEKWSFRNAVRGGGQLR
jgi:hypothetical protein